MSDSLAVQMEIISERTFSLSILRFDDGDGDSCVSSSDAHSLTVDTVADVFGLVLFGAV